MFLQDRWVVQQEPIKARKQYIHTFVNIDCHNV